MFSHFNTKHVALVGLTPLLFSLPPHQQQHVLFVRGCIITAVLPCQAKSHLRSLQQTQFLVLFKIKSSHTFNFLSPNVFCACAIFQNVCLSFQLCFCSAMLFPPSSRCSCLLHVQLARCGTLRIIMTTWWMIWMESFVANYFDNRIVTILCHRPIIRCWSSSTVERPA